MLDDRSCPRLRTIDLVMTAIGDDVLVFDQRSGTLHTLNATCAVIWRACDGTRSVADLAIMFPAQSPHTVHQALVRLAEVDLVEGLSLPASAPVGRLSRRALAAGATAVVPTLLSVTLAGVAASECQGASLYPSFDACIAAAEPRALELQQQGCTVLSFACLSQPPCHYLHMNTRFC